MRTMLFCAAATACAASFLPAQDVRRGLVSYWPLDTTDGLTTPDFAAGYPLELVNMDASNFVPGVRGNCATFDGATELLVRDTSLANPGLPLYNNPRFTICFWVKGNGVAQQDKRIYAECSSLSGNQMYDVGTDNAAAASRTARADIYIRTDTGTQTVNHVKSAQLPLNNAWHHLALTDNNGALRIYVDGVLDTTAVNYTRPVLTLNRLVLGGLRRTTDGSWFAGEIDEVAVWDRILTQAEIQNVMTDGIATPILPTVDALPAGPYAQGDRVQLSVRGYGGGPYTYQWQQDGVDLPGATGTTYLIPALTTATDGAYTVVINETATAPLVLSFPADPAPASETNLVSAWPCDVLDTGVLPATTPDPWGNYAMTCENMDATSLVAGKFDGALQFDGILTYAHRTAGFPICPNPEYTVAFWVKGSGAGQNDMRVFAEGSSTTNTPLFGFGTSNNASNALRVYIRSDSNTVVVNALTATPVFDGDWHHVAWVDRNGAAKLYVDGLQDATSFLYSRTGHTFTMNQTSLGAILRATMSNATNCQMDDVAVWNRALTWSELQQIITSGVPDPVAAVPPQVTLHPAGRTLYEGRNCTFSIQATGTAPLEFQWLKNDNPIPDANGPDYSIPATVPGDTGTYRCRVTNSAGMALSDPAVLTVLPVLGLNTALLNCWPLDSGDPATPDTVSGQDLTLVNTDPTFGFAYLPGFIGNCVYCDGADDLLVRTRSGAGQDIPLTTRPEYSISFWVKGNGVGQTDRRVFAECSNTADSPLFNIGTDNAGTSSLLSIYIRSDAGAVTVNHVKSLMPVFDDAWHHVVWSDYNGHAELYIDGVADRVIDYARPIQTFNATTIGGIGRLIPSHWFAGSVDHVCTWTRALTASEAALLHLIGKGDAISIAAIQPIPESQLRLTVNTAFGDRAYRIEQTADLAAGPWTTVQDAAISPVAAGTFTAEFAAPPPGARRFYRAVAPW